MSGIDRRTVLKGGALGVAAAALPNTSAWAQAVVTRRSISSMAPNDPVIVSYRRAVEAMRRLPASDPRNWQRQAEIHNNFCPHRNWYFLPWHRAYLVAFERICRQLSGNASFALPYWDWTANPQLPAAFANSSAGGAPNPLFNSTRSSQTLTIPSSVAGAGRISTLLAETSFEVFGSTRPTGQNSTGSTWQRRPGVEGPFESGPHDQVHVRISGDMAGFMSPLDPVFWLHHCNIDRLWDSWRRSGRTNPTNALWRNFAFNRQFVAPSGTGTAPFNIAVSGLQSIEALGYRYVPPALVAAAPQVRALASLEFAVAPKPVDFSKLKVAARADEVPLARLNMPVSVTLRLEQPQMAAFESIRPIAPPANITPSRQVQTRQRVLAIIREVDPPENGNAEVRVFLNHPSPGPDTSEQDRHFAGSFTFFGAGHMDHQGSFSFLLDLTETIRRLNIAEVNLRDGLTVQLVPVPIPGVNAENVGVKVGSIEVAIV